MVIIHLWALYYEKYNFSLYEIRKIQRYSSILVKKWSLCIMIFLQKRLDKNVSWHKILKNCLYTKWRFKKLEANFMHSNFKENLLCLFQWNIDFLIVELTNVWSFRNYFKEIEKSDQYIIFNRILTIYWLFDFLLAYFLIFELNNVWSFRKYFKEIAKK